MANQGEQGTGKHGHKDTQEPWPHHGQGGQEKGGQEKGGREGQAQGNRDSGARSGEEASLKEREYRDSEGNVHHHTKTYMEQHEGKKSGSGGGEGSR